MVKSVKMVAIYNAFVATLVIEGGELSKKDGCSFMLRLLLEKYREEKRQFCAQRSLSEISFRTTKKNDHDQSDLFH